MRRSPCIALLGLAAFLISLVGCSNNPSGKAVTIDLTHLGQPGQLISFTEIRYVKDLPAAVRSHLPDGLANSGQKFQVTDFIAEPALPWRRLIFAGISHDYCIVHFEKGGIAHSFYVVLFRLQNSSASVEWVSSTGAKLKSMSGLKAKIEAGRLANESSAVP